MGGNVSVPSIISTALELVFTIYAGKTEYMDKASYNATENVRQFVIRFFPDNYKKFPSLIWDGIRNGIIYTFSPKSFKYQGEIVRFQFYVENKNHFIVYH